MLEYINQLRARGYDIEEAAVESAVLRLRPIIKTVLVATLGLLPPPYHTASERARSVLLQSSLSAASSRIC